jgi:hypothetical protein
VVDSRPYIHPHPESADAPETLHRGVEDATATAIAALRAADARVTAPRRAVLDVLGGRIQHLSARHSPLLSGIAPADV